MPDVITCNALISACGKGKQPERASKLFAWMQGKGLLPDVITYTALIGVLGKDDQLQRAADLFWEMQGKVIEADFLAYETLIKACEESARWDRILKRFGRMKVPEALVKVFKQTSAFNNCIAISEWWKRKCMRRRKGSHLLADSCNSVSMLDCAIDCCIFPTGDFFKHCRLCRALFLRTGADNV